MLPSFVGSILIELTSVGFMQEKSHPSQARNVIARRGLHEGDGGPDVT